MIDMFSVQFLQEHERDVVGDERVPARGVQGLLRHLPQRRRQDRYSHTGYTDYKDFLLTMSYKGKISYKI